MPEHHRASDTDEIWKAVNGNREDISNLNALQAKTDANYEHIKEAISRVEVAINLFTSQSRDHAVEDGKHYARIDQLDNDLEGLAAKMRDHIENHKFWLGLTLGIPAVLLTLWELASNFIKKAGGG